MIGEKGRRGIALVTVIVMLLIFSILGVSVAALTTGQYRFAVKRSGHIASRQAALAAVEKAKYLLAHNADWLNAASFLIVNDQRLAGSDRYCSIDLVPGGSTATMCSLVAWGYAKDSSGHRTGTRGVQVTFTRESPGHVVMSQSMVNGLDLDGCSLEGKVASFQMDGEVEFEDIISLNTSGTVVLNVPPASLVQISETPSPGVMVKEESALAPPPAVVMPDLSSAPSASFDHDVCLALENYYMLDVKNCGLYLSPGTYNIARLNADNVTFHPYGPVRFNIKSTLNLEACVINDTGSCRDFIIYADDGSLSTVYNTGGSFMVTGFTQLAGKYNTIEGSITASSVQMGSSTLRLPASLQQGSPVEALWQEF